MLEKKSIDFSYCVCDHGVGGSCLKQNQKAASNGAEKAPIIVQNGAKE